MSRTYKAVTRRERREGTKGRRSCYRPELPYVQSSINVTGFMQFVQDHLRPSEDAWDYHYDVLLDRHEGIGRSYLEDGYVLRYSRNSDETQSVPKIDWHTERRWRNGQKNRNRITTREARDLRVRSEAVNDRVDSALANGRNPFRRRTRFEHSRYNWGL